MNEQNEQWRPVAGYEGFYEVSNLGRVKSLPRRVARGSGTYTVRGRILTQSPGSLGRPTVNLARSDRGKTTEVHTVVAKAFLGPAPGPTYEVCHNDGDIANNRVENLRWDTHSANMFDRRQHGTDHQANKTHCPAGHPYDEANTYRLPSRPTARYCRACHNARTTVQSRVKRATRKAAAA